MPSTLMTYRRSVWFDNYIIIDNINNGIIIIIDDIIIIINITIIIITNIIITSSLFGRGAL